MDQRANRKWFFMWLKKAMKALEDGSISANSFAVLVVLSQHADYGSGENARPGSPRLASLTGLSEGTVSTALKDGRAAGLIHQVRRGFSNGGAGGNSVYRMNWSASKGAPSPAPASFTALPSADRDVTESSKSQRASPMSQPRTSRKVRRPSGRLQTAKSPAVEQIDWLAVGITQRQADDRGLTRLDYDNFVFLREEDEGLNGINASSL